MFQSLMYAVIEASAPLSMRKCESGALLLALLGAQSGHARGVGGRDAANASAGEPRMEPRKVGGQPTNHHLSARASPARPPWPPRALSSLQAQAFKPRWSLPTLAR